MKREFHFGTNEINENEGNEINDVSIMMKVKEMEMAKPEARNIL